NRQTVVDGVRDGNGNIGIDDKQGHRITYDQSGNRTSDTYYGKKLAKHVYTTPIMGYDLDNKPIYGYEGENPVYTPTTTTTFSVNDGVITERYEYDAANRLTDVYRDDFDLNEPTLPFYDPDNKGLHIETRRYDAADRVIYNGMAGYDAGIAANIAVNDRLSDKLREIGITPETHTSIYEDGRLVRQNNRNFNRGHTSDVTYKYDNAGNMDLYDMQAYGDNGYVNRYDYSYEKREGYNLQRIDVTRNGKSWNGATVNDFDANGNLIKVTDKTKSENNRELVNDNAGRVLLKTKGTALRNTLTIDGQLVFKNSGNQVHTLIANGEVIGSSSDSQTPDTFGVSYVPINDSRLTAPPSGYTVHAGDSLQSIAKTVWGDGSLWYLIAEANGLSGNVAVGAAGDVTAELVEGQVITIPSRANTVHNDFRTFKPYDPSSVVGDMTPNLPIPADEGGCGGIGQIVVIIVAIVATVFTAGAASVLMAGGSLTGAGLGGIMSAGMTALAGGGTLGAAALGSGLTSLSTGAALGGAIIGGAVGSIASQGAAIAMGMQDSFSWSAVGKGALGAGIGAGVGAALNGAELLAQAQTTPLTTAQLMRNAAVTSIATQGVMVATGLQEKFSWGAVAGAAIAAPIANSVGKAIGGKIGDLNTNAYAQFTQRFAEGITRNVIVTGVSGGKVNFANIATDAFGNALGDSLADQIGRGSQQTEVLYSAEEQAQDFARENARFAAMGIRQAGRPLLLADSGQFMTDVGGPYGDVNFGEPVKPNATSDAMFNALVDGIQNPRPAAGPRIVLDDFGNPVGGQTGAGYLDQSEIDRENYLLASRSRTISSNSPSGMLTQDGKPYYLIMRDPNGLGIYQSADVTTVTPLGAQANSGVTPASVGSPEISNRLRGALSERYETGGRGPGTVSTGDGDPGGVSYGSYQLASRRGRPQEFLQNEGSPWADQFTGMDPTVRNGPFAQTWRRIAQETPQQFFSAQHDFIERTHYDVSVERTLRQTGLNINEQPAAVQDVVWSTAVQHGPTNSVITRAYRAIPDVDPTSSTFSEQFINAIYDERGRTRPDGTLVYFRSASPAQQAGVIRRFTLERNDALQMLRNQGAR
ncbi:MAG TPA: LysM peptidoglycan-binding domain-containing protein, partial [Noviherbaspirillum sp.]